MSSELNHFFLKDEISFMSPYYEGDYFLITVDTVRDMQVEDGFISEDDEELKRDGANRILLTEKRLPHLIVAIHIQNQHVGYGKDLEVLEEYQIIGRTRADLKRIMYAYRHLCLHCTRYPHILRQPLHKILMGRKPRTVLRMDYLFVSKEAGHLLVIVDTFSRKTYLKHTLSEDAKTAVMGLMEWNAAFGLVENFILVTDKGSHFANELMAYAVPAFKGKHEMCVPYSPWTNGSVENRNKNLLRILRQLCSELHMLLRSSTTCRYLPEEIRLVMSYS
ncbi:MAG: transposase family protein [Cytophagales bacterium]|nr:transposase family protein [Cytophagales bacterium]